MFSLIITIISIALVAALALATIYYGGSAFTKGGDSAKAAQLINEGQQLQGARTLAIADNKLSTVSTVAGLQTQNYLSQLPAGWVTTTDVTPASGEFVSAAQSDAVCAAVNAKSGNTGAATLDATVVYGCTTGDKVVRYKF